MAFAARERLPADTNDSDVYARRYDASGFAKGAEFRVNSFTNGFQRNQSVAMASDDSFVVVWESLAPLEDVGKVVAQRYNGAGGAMGGEFLVSELHRREMVINGINHISQGQYGGAGALAMDANGNFVVAWTDVGVGVETDVFAKVFDDNGVSVGGRSA